jgi:two-component sensor histidine kinase
LTTQNVPADLLAELEDLRKRHAALEQELQSLTLTRTLEQKSLLKLSAQLDALLRSSSEVRYRINRDWSELEQLQGGGFIADTNQSNSDWIDGYIPLEHQDLVRAEIKRAIAAKDVYNIEHKVNRVDGSVGWALSRAVPLFDDLGEIESWMGAASDISDRKMSEDAQRLLNSELAHRMKNTLAMVQAIVSQTLRTAGSMEAAVSVVKLRLQALADAQDILTQTQFTAADLHDVASAALGVHIARDGRIDIRGTSHSLTPQQALGISLSIHELATNAVKYGALSNEVGRVVISWGLVDGGFVFEWLEQGGPEVQMPTRRSFGSTLIERLVPSYFGGVGVIDFRPQGIHFKLTGELPGAD